MQYTSSAGVGASSSDRRSSQMSGDRRGSQMSPRRGSQMTPKFGMLRASSIVSSHSVERSNSHEDGLYTHSEDGVVMGTQGTVIVSSALNSGNCADQHNHRIMNMEDNEVPDFNTITINISGKRFETSLSTIERFPLTKLGDPEKRKKYYNVKKEEYFFDRNQEAFHAILYYYQSKGSLYIPPSVQESVFYQELDFWGISTERPSENGTAFGEEEDKAPHKFKFGEPQRKIYIFLNKPKSSTPARVWASIDIAIIMISVVNLVIESYGQAKRTPGRTDTPFFVVDAICVVFFTTDILARMLVCPVLKTFFKKPLNWFDFLAIMPFYMEVSMGSMMRNGSMNNNILMPFKILRIFRITRVLKLIRHSGRLILMIQVLLDCVYELAMLLVIWLMGVFIFGTIMFYIEHEQEGTEFKSIMHSCWWSVVSMSTVGYGDMYPETALGKLVTSVLVFCSMVFLALPMTIIVSKFNKAFETLKKPKVKKKEAEEEAANNGGI